MLWGPVAILPAILIYIAVLVRDGAPWRGDPMWTSECLGLTLFMTAPLAAGISAIDASYVSQWSNAFLTGVASSPKKVYLWAGAWVALPLVALHAIAFALGLAIGRITVAELGLESILATAVQGLALIWFCALGSLIGRYCEPFIAGLAGAITAFAITYTMGLAGVGADHGFSLLDVGGATVPQIGIVYNHSYLTWQSGILVATTLVIANLGIRYHNRRPQVVSLRMLISMGSIIALLVLGQSLGPSQRKFPGDPSPPTECRGLNPTICLYREQRIWASTIDGRLRRLADSARHAGYMDCQGTAGTAQWRT